MKSLSLPQPLVIVMVGIPGSGKSYFARQFASMFSAPLVSTDFVRHTLFPDSVYSREEDALVSDITLAQLTELLKTNKTLIYDGGSNARIERQDIEKLARAAGYEPLLLWVQTDTPTAQIRSTKRSTRRGDDALNSPMDTETFDAVVRRFTQPHAKEDVVVISGKHTFAAQARVVLKRLSAPRSDAMDNLSIVPSSASTQTRPIRHDIQPQTRHRTTQI